MSKTVETKGSMDKMDARHRKECTVQYSCTRSAKHQQLEAPTEMLVESCSISWVVNTASFSTLGCGIRRPRSDLTALHDTIALAVTQKTPVISTIPSEPRKAKTIGRTFAIVATAKYNKPCARRCSFKGDLDGCLDSFTMDNTNTRRS